MKPAARMILFAVILSTGAMSQTKAALPIADSIFYHGNIYTGVTGNSSFHEVERAEALAIKGDRILAVGRDEDIRKYKGPATLVIDLQGHFVVPGFNDAHMHLTDAGFKGLTVDLTGARSVEQIRERVRKYLPTAAPGEWITGSGWDETLWRTKELPTRWDIDEVTSDHPVYLERIDGHVAVANTLALKMARVTLASKDPEGGEIGRDASGQPNGVLRETARELVTSNIPQPTPDKRRRAVEAALEDLARSGITSAQDYSDTRDADANWEDFKLLEQFEQEGKLTVRISEWLPFDLPVQVLIERRESHDRGDPMLHTGLLKAFLDGSLGSHTAAMLQPYADDPKNSGLPGYEQAKLNEMAIERVKAGFQLGFHAIGDKGVQMALDAFDAAEKSAHAKQGKAVDGSDHYRLRIEHAGEVANQEDDGVPEVLKVLELAQKHGVPKVKVGSRRVKPGLYAQGPAGLTRFLQFFPQFGLLYDLRGALPDAG